MSGDQDTGEGFAPDWLSMRRAADERARAQPLIGQAFASVAAASMRICDLGAGTGATLAALKDQDPRPQAWTLIDADAGLLARVPEIDDPRITVETRLADLGAPGPLWRAPPDLVTASALFDLAGAGFVNTLVDALASAQVPLLAMLNYDGTLRFAPAHASDEAIREAFNSHQRGSKGLGGNALGPDAAGVLALALARCGYRVTLLGSPWRLEAQRDGPLIAATLEGIATAAQQMMEPDIVDGWLASRLRATTQMIVGHVDLLATPS